MSKVINIATRKPETEPPFNSDDAKAVLSYLMDYSADKRSSMTYGEHIIMRELLKLIENNSVVNMMEIVNEKAAK